MPREVSGADYEFLDRAELLTFEEIERLARIFVGDHWRGARSALTGGEPLRAPRGGAACRDARADPPARGPGDDHQRLGAGAQGAGARGTLGCAGSRSASTASTTRCSPPSTTSASRSSACWRGSRPPLRRGSGRSRSTWSSSAASTRTAWCRWPALPWQRPHRALHRVHGRRPQQRLADGRRRPAAEIVAMIDAELPLEPVAPNYPGEVVERWRYSDGSGEIGVIASVTRPFCGGCTRARLSADGQALHLPVRHHRSRPARAAARRRLRRGDLRGDRRDLARAGGPLLGAAHGRDSRPAQGRDVLHRRVGHSAVALAAATSSRPRSRGSCRSDGRSRPPRS